MNDEQVLPDAATLRRLAADHDVDPRTIIKSLKGEPIRTVRARDAARDAAAEWRRIQKKKARTGP